jgi:hypothetical protein
VHEKESLRRLGYVWLDETFSKCIYNLFLLFFNNFRNKKIFYSKQIKLKNKIRKRERKKRLGCEKMRAKENDNTGSTIASC